MLGETDLAIKVAIENVKEALAQLKSIKAGIGDIGKETDDTAKKGVAGWKQQRKEIMEMSGPLATVRFAVMRLRFLWLLTFGLMAKAAIDLNKELNDLEVTSIKLGTDFNSLVRNVKGFNVSISDVRIASEGFAEIGRTAKMAWAWLGETISKVVSYPTIFVRQMVMTAERAKEAMKEGTKFKMPTFDEARKDMEKFAESQKRFTKESIALDLQRVDKINKIMLSEYEYKRKLSEQYIEVLKRAGFSEVEMSQARAAEEKQLYMDRQRTAAEILGQLASAEGDFTEQLRNEWALRLLDAQKYDKAERAVYLEGVKKKLELERLHYYGRQAIWEQEIQLAKDSLDAVDKLFADTFIDGLDNKFSNAREILRSFFLDLRNMLIRVAMQAIVTRIAMSFIPGFQAGVSAGSVQPGFADAFTSASSSFGKGIPGLQEGGIVRRPTLALVGEGGPEAIVPLSRGGGNGMGQTTIISINAIDTQSFAEALRKNPEAVTTIVQKNIDMNKYLRRTTRGR